MNYISLKHLKALGACEEQVEKFQEVFGKAYKEAKAPLLKAYQESCAKLFATMWWGAGEASQKLKKALGEPE